MTTFMQEKVTCAICHAVNEYNVLASTNTFGGGPDLDLRPAEMQRSTMHSWIQECPKCGYISGRISDKRRVSKRWLRSEQYQTCDGIFFASDLAKRFYKYYLICMQDREDEDAFFAILHAAWACDDKQDVENAKLCRKIAISLADKLIESGHQKKDNLQLMKADLMRRAGLFDELVDQYASVRFYDEFLNQILDFQIKKAKERDAGCYRVADAAGSR